MPAIYQPNPAHSCRLDTPLGTVFASAVGEALTGLWFNGQKYIPHNWDSLNFEPDYPVFVKLRAWLAGYFSGSDIPPDLPLAPQGTPFQKAVWNILLEIPHGQVTTYGAIARKIAAGRQIAVMSARAVGQAVGHNPIAILIPCHRVIGANRSLTGYAAGLDRKRYLLNLEHIDL
ncbi:MAG TPA: methylated-DNA--[protein]-cysteine S-methyltransferase [Dehalococcoidales bacterium]|nr:methylated-DNA--[protein]-cysteine S-methyltransferase [Dehalococcoidales bacterium]